MDKSHQLLAISRPARIVSDESALDREFRAARWTHHRLLDFEDEHQRHMDETAEICAPGIGRVARIVARLKRRQRRADRSTGWSPNPHQELCATLQARLGSLRKQRDSDPRWKAATKWADTPGPDAPARGGGRKQAGETAEDFAERLKTRRTLLTRREQRRAELYANRQVHWSTWNGLCRQVDTARRAVIERRKQGLPSEWRRPRFRHPTTLYGSNKSAFLVDTSGKTFWVVKLRLIEGWAEFKIKPKTWRHAPFYEFRTCQLTRRRDGERWGYSASLTVEVDKRAPEVSDGVVAISGGYREHGHPEEADGLRAISWAGSDGRTGTVILPIECRERADLCQRLQSEIDERAKSLPDRSRHAFRRSAMRRGVRTEQEDAWLRYEMRVERRIAANRRRIQNLREHVYLGAVRELVAHYATIVVDDASADSLRRLGRDAPARRRQRQNRDMVAEYSFRQLCERSGATIVPVSARNSTGECPECGQVGEVTADLVVACESCGHTRDQDIGAATVILRRGMEALEKAGAKA